MSIWASWGERVRPVRYQHSGVYPSERHERLEMEFAHIPLHLNRHYRRQRWLRVSVGGETIEFDFCLNVREATKLRDVLDFFIDQPNREGGGE